MTTVFLRVLGADDKAAALLEAVSERASTRGSSRFEVDPESFASVPRSPFAYWVSGRVRALFKDLPPVEAEGRTAKQGLATADDFRFVRAWWAVDAEGMGTRWFPLAKGGKFSRFYADVHLVVNWDHGGAEIRNLRKPGSDRVASRPQNVDFFFRPGLTWSDRTTKSFSARLWPRGGVFSVKGSAGFFAGDEYFALALLNSASFNLFLSLLVGAGAEAARSYQVGTIGAVPWPSPDATLSNLAQRGWSLKRALDTCTETSHAFTLPALLQVTGANLTGRVSAWSRHVGAIEAGLANIQVDIDERCLALYDIDASDCRAITEDIDDRACGGEAGSDDAAAGDEGSDDEELRGESNINVTNLAAELASWAACVAFGRFDVRLATGLRVVPAEPDPFDPLPVCSPAMLTGPDGLPPILPPSGYPLRLPEDGLLVDDPGQSRDLTAAVRTVFELIFGADADRWWEEISALLDPKRHDLGHWIATGFFEHHLKRHSQSRRKVPILWQLGTPSGRYSIWLYSHRLTSDSLFHVQNDVIGPKLVFEERALTRLVQTAAGNPSATERSEMARQAEFVEELRTMLGEIKRVAPLWYPDLDDGVVLTMAPLWRLVPQHKSWQTELKGKWDELAAGKYDWSHVAMHLWPERVVPKCAVDRSRAIAHGLEEELWKEDADGKWASRQIEGASVERLIQERSSAAVKAALADLLAAG